MCFLMMALSVINVITRSAFQSPIFGAVELVSYFGLTLGAFSIAMNELTDGNVSMTLLVDVIKPKARKTVSAIVTILAAVFYIILAYRFFVETLVTYNKGTFTSTLSIPYYVINIIMAIGYVCGFLALLLKAARDITFVVADGKEEKGGNEQ